MVVMRQTARVLPLDIDVLLFGDLVGNFDGLILPRAEILKNAFVLWPLSLIAPDRVHPGVGKSFATFVGRSAD